MTPEDFIKEYEQALKSQDWLQVDPLFHEKVCVTFSSGTLHEGKPQVKIAFEKNFAAIKSEEYQMSNVRWIMKTESLATYLFDYNWKGIINGKRIMGNGIGTSVLLKENDRWVLLTENLHKPPTS